VLRNRPDLTECRFPDLGITVAVFEPGRPSGLYHAESAQEDFLVLGGECVAIVGAGVEEQTSSPNEAYSSFPHWQPGRTAPTEELPWRRRSS
jgi:uncharacterized cupin superfamily protein